MEASTYLLTYAFPPGTKVKGPVGSGMLIGVMQMWFRDETVYSMLIDGTDNECYWVSQQNLLESLNGWEVVEVPERTPGCFPDVS